MPSALSVSKKMVEQIRNEAPSHAPGFHIVPVFAAPERQGIQSFWRDDAFRLAATISIVAHLLMFAASHFSFTSSSVVIPSGIRVGVASLPKAGRPDAGGGAAAKKAAQEKKPPTPKPEPKKAKPIEKAEPVKQARTDLTKEAETVALNPKKSKHAPKKTAERPKAEAKPTPKEPESVLGGLMDLVKNERAATGSGKGTAGRSGTQGNYGVSELGDAAGVMGDLYLSRLGAHVGGYWDIPPSAQISTLSVDIRIVIRVDGRVHDAKVQTSSGNATFDDAAMRAIRRAEPLPVPPRDLKPPVAVTLRMRPPQ